MTTEHTTTNRSEDTIVILGLMGVGKTTTGLALAAELGWSYTDSDRDIERLTGGTGRDFAAEKNIETLHALEASVAIGALARPEKKVVTMAASVVEQPLVRELLLRNAFVVLLRVSIDETLKRQAADEHRRPMDVDELSEIARLRAPLFAEVANIELDGSKPTSELVSEIIERRAN